MEDLEASLTLMGISGQQLPPPVLAALAEHENRDIGSNDGSGMVERYATLYRSTIVSLESNGTVTTGVRCDILAYGGTTMDDYECTVTQMNAKAEQYLVINMKKVPYPFRNPEFMCDPYTCTVDNPDFHPTHNNGVAATMEVNVLPNGSAIRDKIRRTLKRTAKNKIENVYRLPFECERTILDVHIKGANGELIKPDANPEMIKLHHEKYSDCFAARKPAFLKAIGMYRIITVTLRKANEAAEAKAAVSHKVCASPQAGGGAPDPYAAFTA
eukprot:scaffold82151_cov32-Attheya_sp.AAC.2